MALPIAKFLKARGLDGPYRQALNLQRIAYNLATDEKTDAPTLCQLIQAWDRMEERKRVIRMKPKPAAARVPAEPKARVRSPAPEAPGPVTAAGPTDPGPGPTDPKV